MISAIFTSPLQRALETARVFGDLLGLEVQVDDRLRERTNWEEGQSLEEFLADWGRATWNRSYAAAGGDSSATAGARLRQFLEEVAASHRGRQVIAVAHGGVTVDLLRDLMGDDQLIALAPTLLSEGPSSAAITRLKVQPGHFEVVEIASGSHVT